MALKDPKDEMYCQIWHETGNKSKAYRTSRPNSSKWKDATVHNKASALSRKSEIKARFDELQADALKGHNITIESLLKELDEARSVALSADTPQSSAAVTATMSKAKLVGLDKNVIDINATVTTRTTLDDFYS